MSDIIFDVVGVGNAIVDVLAQAEDDFLTGNSLLKGAMTIIDEGAAETLYGLMGPGREVSGGSAANTMAGLASLGGRGAFVGKVHDDQLGAVFAHDIRSAGVNFDCPPTAAGASTARCLIFVTPDAQRTMQTYLGACVELGPDDINPHLISSAAVTYLEGYLWDPPGAKQAFRKAARLAEEAGGRVALSLSDSFCVDRHRGDFLELVQNHVDILFANEDEIKSLYEVDSFDAALQKVRAHCDVAALTRGAQGSVVVSGAETHVLDAEPVESILDSTGAGDSYAAGFLYGLTREMDPARCGRLGGIAAAEIISHFGARPECSLAELAAEKLPAP